VVVEVEVVVFVVVTTEEVEVVVVFEAEVAVVVSEVVEDVVISIKKNNLFFFLPVICHFLYDNYNFFCCFFYSLYTQNKQHETKNIQKANVFVFSI
jgi:hypothetical protein